MLRLFDPCCGEGLALAALAQAVAERTGLAVQTWGVEISPQRATEAATRLDLVVPAPCEAVSWRPAREGVASVLWLNPAYDQNGRGGRMELDFLKVAMPALVAGGVLAYVGGDPDASRGGYDRARRARRQPGSTVKPRLTCFLADYLQKRIPLGFGKREGHALFIG